MRERKKTSWGFKILKPSIQKLLIKDAVPNRIKEI